MGKIFEKIGWFFSLLGTILVAMLLIRKSSGRGEVIDKRLDDNKREIGDSIDRTGQSIDRQRTAIDRQGQEIDRAIDIVGSNQDRELDDKQRKFNALQRENLDGELVEESRATRQRAKAFLDSH